jgi:AcrR family transcriptional regulator
MGLSLGRIAEAAIAVADTEGIAAVSMQRVDEDLGFSKMSLYRHVAN